MEGEILSIETASKIARLEKENEKFQTQNIRMKKEIGILCNRLDARNKQVEKANDYINSTDFIYDEQYKKKDKLENILNGGENK